VGRRGSAAQESLVERLFVAYFEEGANVANHEHARRLGRRGRARLPGAERGAGERDAFADEVRADLHGAGSGDLTGVPAFVVDDQFVIPGAQDVDTFVNLLGRIRDRA
jgi:predicted DsbA family dithiol-disulfide isomerase